jgi:TorA maturation chaperone TorD
MSESDEARVKEGLLGESLFLGLLGRLLYNPPEIDWLNSLIEEQVFNEIPFEAGHEEIERGGELMSSWAEKNAKGLSKQAFKALNADHTRLFVGVGQVLAPPWESVYFSQDRLVFQEQTLEVRNWYRRFGLELEKLHKEPDDHIGLELSFLAHLAEIGLKLLDEGDKEKFALLKSEKQKFLSEHLLRWGPSWCTLVVEHAKTDFYSGLAHLTLGALMVLANRYDVQIPKEVRK